MKANHNNHNRINHGHTLVEMLSVLGILTVLVGGMIPLISNDVRISGRVISAMRGVSSTEKEGLAPYDAMARADELASKPAVAQADNSEQLAERAFAIVYAGRTWDDLTVGERENWEKMVKELVHPTTTS